MAKFEVYFLGLICHVSPNSTDLSRKAHAAMVKAANHRTRISIDGGAFTATGLGQIYPHIIALQMPGLFPTIS